MKVLIKVLLVLFLILSGTLNSHSFPIGGTIKGVGKFFTEIKTLFKGTAATGAGAANDLKAVGDDIAKGADELLKGGSSSFDNLALEISKYNKIDSQLISKVGQEQHLKIIKSIDNKTDDVIMAENDIQNVTKKDNNTLLLTHANYRIWRVEKGFEDYKPDNRIYVCSNQNEFYYFALLPNKNLAILKHSTNDKILSQQLEILESNPNFTSLVTTKGNDKRVFIFMPNYKIRLEVYDPNNNYKQISSKSSSTGECYVTTEQRDGQVQLARYNSKKKYISKSQYTPFINSNAFYVILIVFGYAFIKWCIYKIIQLNFNSYKVRLNFSYVSAYLNPIIYHLGFLLLFANYVSYQFSPYANIGIIAALVLISLGIFAQSKVMVQWIKLHRSGGSHDIYSNKSMLCMAYFNLGFTACLSIAIILSFFL